MVGADGARGIGCVGREWEQGVSGNHKDEDGMYVGSHFEYRGNGGRDCRVDEGLAYFGGHE